MRARSTVLAVALAAILALVVSCATQTTSARGGLSGVEHILVIYAENRSFDNLYGLFPGANGIANATPAQFTQVDRDGTVLATLPPIWNGKAPSPDFPTDLPNRPFRIDAPPINLPLSVPTRDLVHRFYQNVEQINGGRNDRFVAASDAGGLAMGYYDGSTLPLWQWARDYVLADNFFMGAFGGSFLNHFWLVCACTPEDPEAPAARRIQLDERGWLKTRAGSPASVLSGAPEFMDGEVTPDGYAVNTMQPPWQPSRVPPTRDRSEAPHPASAVAEDHRRHPERQGRHVGVVRGRVECRPPGRDAGARSAATDHRDQGERRAVLRSAPPALQLLRPLRAGHRGSGAASQGLHGSARGHRAGNPAPGRLLQAAGHLESAPRLRRRALGRHSHRRAGWPHQGEPPAGDRWGPGTRIPTLIISPRAKRGFVDHTPYDTTSIIKLITRRFGLEPLPGVRPGAGDLSAAFE